MAEDRPNDRNMHGVSPTMDDLAPNPQPLSLRGGGGAVAKSATHSSSPPSSKAVRSQAVARLLSSTAPPSRFVVVLSVVLSLVGALVSCGVLLYGEGVVRVRYEGRVAHALALKSNSVTSRVFFGAIAVLGSTALSYGVFLAGSGRRVRVRS